MKTNDELLDEFVQAWLDPWPDTPGKPSRYEQRSNARRALLERMLPCPHQCGHDECELVIGSLQAEVVRLHGYTK